MAVRFPKVSIRTPHRGQHKRGIQHGAELVRGRELAGVDVVVGRGNLVRAAEEVGVGSRDTIDLRQRFLPDTVFQMLSIAPDFQRLTALHPVFGETDGAVILADILLVVTLDRAVAVGDFVEDSGGFLAGDIHRVVILRHGDVVSGLGLFTEEVAGLRNAVAKRIVEVGVVVGGLFDFRLQLPGGVFGVQLLHARGEPGHHRGGEGGAGGLREVALAAGHPVVFAHGHHVGFHAAVRRGTERAEVGDLVNADDRTHGQDAVGIGGGDEHLPLFVGAFVAHGVADLNGYFI